MFAASRDLHRSSEVELDPICPEHEIESVWPVPDSFLDSGRQLEGAFGDRGDGLIVAIGLGGSRSDGGSKNSGSNKLGKLKFKLDRLCRAGLFQIPFFYGSLPL